MAGQTNICYYQLQFRLTESTKQKIEHRVKVGELSAEVRRVIEGIAIPEDINEEITRHRPKIARKPASLL